MDLQTPNMNLAQFFSTKGLAYDSVGTFPEVLSEIQYIDKFQTQILLVLEISADSPLTSKSGLSVQGH